MVPLTDIIIVSHNRLKMLKRCLLSIKRYTPSGRYTLTVVDNNSTDGSREFLKKSNACNHILLNYNKACPTAFNLAARRTHNDFVVSLNDDLEVTRGWLHKLYREMKPGVGVVGVKPVCSDGRIFYADQLAQTIADIGHKEKDHGQRNYVKECDGVWGGCLLIRREALEKIGYFDEKLFTMDDVDFCLRVRIAGYKIIYNGRVKIIHLDANRPRLHQHQSLQRFREKWKDFPMFPLKDSNPIDRVNTLGLKHLQRGLYKSAIKEFKKAFRFGDIFTLYRFMGYAYYNLGSYHKAISNYKKALKINRYDSLSRRLMGITLEAQKRYKLALYHFRQTVNLYPSYADGYNSLGVYYLNRDRPAKAITFFKKAINYDKCHPSSHYNLGLAYEKLQCFQEAKKSYKTGLRINPKDSGAQNNLRQLSE